MRTDVKWGLILGAAIVVWTLAIHVMGFYTTRISAGLIADNVAIVLPIAAMVLALLEYRRRKGSLSIKDALLTGVVVGAVTGMVSVMFLWIYHHYINPQWSQYLVEHALRTGAEKGQSPAEIDQAVANIQRSASDIAQVAGGLLGSVIMCTVLGLLLGLVLRRPAEKVSAA
jgi:hypothetical protein